MMPGEFRGVRLIKAREYCLQCAFYLLAVLRETAVTLDELKGQRRWVLWKLENLGGKETKVPYQVSGRKAQANNPATWSTHAQCIAVVSRYSGVGLTLGDGVFGVDIDKCCDAATGKFTLESREIVIGLDSYGEYSPSGTGAHVFCLGEMPEKYRGCNTGKKGDAIVGRFQVANRLS